MSNVKMFLFGRWMSTQYNTDTMNRSKGTWWKKRINHFNTIILPKYIKNGSYDDADAFLNDIDEFDEIKIFKSRTLNKFKNED